MAETRAAPAWSWFVRLTHWLVAAAVVVNLFNDTGWWHRTLGYAALGMVGARLVYGVLSALPSSRLWWPAFSDLRHHLQLMARREPDARPGHNPLGQYAVYLMWTLIALLALTGWLSRTDELWGEDWPVDLHAWLADGMLAMALLHLAAVIAMSLWERRNLVKAMVTGASR